MSVKARCLNYTGCLLAYRGEVIELAANAPLVCPECGKTVSSVRGGGKGVGKIVAALVIVGALGAGAFLAKPYLSKLIEPKPAAEETETPASTPSPRVAQTDPTPDTPSIPVMRATLAEPPKQTEAPKTIDIDVTKAGNQRVRDEVLKRVDVMPNISATNKDRLYNSVQRARSMGLLVTIPFPSGSTKITPNEVPTLKAELEKPAVMKFREDPTAVFVVLGFADPIGDEKKNITISQARADSVLESMRDKCGINNVMHAVAMGGSKMLDTANLEKNRVAEVWVVLP